MASNINANNIDGAYPVAGQDNDSQGFRTNFTNIKQNFSAAKSELEDLQSKAILKSALTGTALENNMGGSLFFNAATRSLAETRVDFGTVGAQAINLDFSAASNFTAATSGDVAVTFSNFPAAGKVGRVTLEITINNAALGPSGHWVQLPGSVTKGINTIQGWDGTYLHFNAIGAYAFEFMTDDGGTTFHIADLTRNRTLEARTPTAIGVAGDTTGMMFFSSGFLYVCVADFDGSTLIWRKATLAAI